MPYIKPEDRNKLEDDIGRIESPGELNYLITLLINDYISTNEECYQTYNDIMGALEGAKLELYRRKIAPYEDQKIKENGDV